MCRGHAQAFNQLMSQFFPVCAGPGCLAFNSVSVTSRVASLSGLNTEETLNDAVVLKNMPSLHLLPKTKARQRDLITQRCAEDDLDLLFRRFTCHGPWHATVYPSTH